MVQHEVIGMTRIWQFNRFATPEPVLRSSRRLIANQRIWHRFAISANDAEAISARVSRIEHETDDTVSIYFHPRPSLNAYQSGQFITCLFNIDGLEHRRAYSLSEAAPTDSGECCITVKRVKNGRVSGFVHNTLQVGDRFRILGPSGDFVLDSTWPEKLMIAAGSGMTPIRALLQAHFACADPAPLTLIAAHHDSDDILFRKQLLSLAQQHSQFRLIWCLSRSTDNETPPAGEPYQLVHTRLSTRRLHALLNTLDLPVAQIQALLCGPPDFVELARQTLQERAFPQSQVTCESFFAAPVATASHPDEPQRIYFTAWKKQVTAQPGESILQAGLAAGLPLPHSCQVGGCGHCRIQITEGEVLSDEPNCLSSDEKAAGYRLACVSYASGPITVSQGD